MSNMDSENEISSPGDLKTSDTVIELKSASTDKDNPDSTTDKRPKLPPLDVTLAQEYQQQNMAESRSPTRTTSFDRRRGPRERKIGHRRVNNEGEITFKKIHTSQIMGSIQLGIGHAVGSLASKPERDLLMQDFTIVETTNFVKDGSNITPAHHYSEFKFKSYAPVAFRYFRDLFGIPPDDFLLSLVQYPMVELTNPGASGSIFYLTDDDEFIIKTVSHTESEFLMTLLPGYYMNLNQNPRTLLPKFYGLYCYQCGGKNVRLVIMNNLLPSSIRLHQKYDLKGSTFKRKASKYERKKKSPTYKDLDFMEMHPDGIILEHETYNSLIKTITRDCRVLESFRIMDYSLLVGIHNLDEARREKLEQKMEIANGKLTDEAESASPDQMPTGATSNLVRSKSMNKQRLAAYSTAMEQIQAQSGFKDELDDVPPGGIPAKNAQGDNLLLFMGIIDILQNFRLRKKLEHRLKSVVYDGDTVSVHNPGFYAHRFHNFMSKIVFRKSQSTLKHSPSKRKGSSAKKTSTSTEPEITLNTSKKTNEIEHNQKEDLSSSTLSATKDLTDASKDVNRSEIVSKAESSVEYKKSANPHLQRPFKISTLLGDKSEVVSLSQGTFQECSTDCPSETICPSGLSLTTPTFTYTPPHSVETSTPTNTEGTPSFSESTSSASVDAGRRLDMHKFDEKRSPEI